MGGMLAQAVVEEMVDRWTCVHSDKFGSACRAASGCHSPSWFGTSIVEQF
jgi:hypothetical protein